MIAGERREVVSIYPEVRLLTWAGVMLISSGVGLYIAKHLDDVGPLAIAVIIGIAAIACYAWAWWKRSREVSLADDYVLLLAALLASAGVGYIEHHYHLLGGSRQILRRGGGGRRVLRVNGRFANTTGGRVQPPAI